MVDDQNNDNNQLYDITALLGFLPKTTIKFSLDLGDLYVALPLADTQSYT